MKRIARAVACGLAVLACASPLRAQAPVVVPADAPRSQLDRDETPNAPAMKYIKPAKNDEAQKRRATKVTVVKRKPAPTTPKDAAQ